MIAIITGDLINSDTHQTLEWITILKAYLSEIGKTPEDWEIYRGDEFQVKVSADSALHIAIQCKARLKTIKDLDVRMGIGLGTETFKGSSVSQSNGTAYQRSGRIFETLKEQKLNLAISTGDSKLDNTLNLIMTLGLHFMDDWSQVSAEMVTIAMKKPGASQQEIAEQLGVQQSAISQRQKRARLDLVIAMIDYYEKAISEYLKSESNQDQLNDKKTTDTH